MIRRAMMHPELRDRVRRLLEEDVGERAPALLLAAETAWVTLDLPRGDPPFGRVEILALASLLAGLLEADAIAREDLTEWPDQRKRVMLRLIDGGAG